VGPAALRLAEVILGLAVKLGGVFLAGVTVTVAAGVTDGACAAKSGIAPQQKSASVTEQIRQTLQTWKR
jgi:hypothetical protein